MPGATLQLFINGEPRGPRIQADAQGAWHIEGLTPFKGNDQLTSTQIINAIPSGPSSAVAVSPNSPPFLNPIGDQKVNIGKTLTILLNATDPDGDALTFSSIPLPAHSTFTQETGLFTFTPSEEQVGTTTLTFTVSDGLFVHAETVTITVSVSRNLFILLDNPDGTVGEIEVANPQGNQILDQANQGVGLDNSHESPSEPFTLPAAEIEEIFQDAIDAKPEPPLKFTLYFVMGTTKLDMKSIQVLQEALSAIANRTAPDIEVIGHTDRTASDEFNNRLSTERAKVIRDTLLATGIDPQAIQVSGHGENNPLVKTPDGVAEPLNRRVEIMIR
jgi:outer membrane protein OmpA-like peptidoglycan-associated protein